MFKFNKLLGSLPRIIFSLLVITFVIISANSAYAGLGDCDDSVGLISNPRVFELTKYDDRYSLKIEVDSSIDFNAVEVWPSKGIDCDLEGDTLICEYYEIEEGFEHLVVVDLIDSGRNCSMGWIKGYIEQPEENRPHSNNFSYKEELAGAEVEDSSQPEPTIEDNDPAIENMGNTQPQTSPSSPLQEPSLDENLPDDTYEAIDAVAANRMMMNRGGGSCSLAPQANSSAAMTGFSIFLFLLLVISSRRLTKPAKIK